MVSRSMDAEIEAPRAILARGPEKRPKRKPSPAPWMLPATFDIHSMPIDVVSVSDRECPSVETRVAWTMKGASVSTFQEYPPRSLSSIRWSAPATVETVQTFKRSIVSASIVGAFEFGIRALLALGLQGIRASRWGCRFLRHETEFEPCRRRSTDRRWHRRRPDPSRTKCAVMICRLRKAQSRAPSAVAR